MFERLRTSFSFPNLFPPKYFHSHPPIPNPCGAALCRAAGAADMRPGLPGFLGRAGRTGVARAPSSLGRPGRMHPTRFAALQAPPARTPGIPRSALRRLPSLQPAAPGGVSRAASGSSHWRALPQREAPRCGGSALCPAPAPAPTNSIPPRRAAGTHHADLGADEHVGHGARVPARLPPRTLGSAPTPAPRAPGLRPAAQTPVTPALASGGANPSAPGP